MLRMATAVLASFAMAVVGVDKSLGDDESLGDRMFHLEWTGA